MDAANDLKWFIFVLIGLWVVWFLTGGPEHKEAQGGIFIKPPPPLDTGETYGGNLELPGAETRTQGSQSGGTENETSISPFHDEVFISDASGGRESDVSKEYIVLRAPESNKNPVLITGWKLKNSAGRSATIGKAAALPFSNEINTETALFLAPGERAIIATGRSPLGVSFQANSCSGYFGQFQNFTPALSPFCPRPARSAPGASCQSYITSVQNCTTPVDIPSYVGSQCVSFAHEELNYNTCVREHRNDPYFYEKEWRVFLGESTQFWKDSVELVRLYDGTGKLVDSKTY